MKTRNGFVSNSSSSSFVVVFPTKPESVEEVKDYMFTKHQQEVGSIQAHGKPELIDDICSVVLKDIKRQDQSASVDMIRESLENYYYSTHYDIIDKLQPHSAHYSTDKEYLEANDKFYNEIDRLGLEFAENYAKEIFNEEKNSFVLCTEYADDGDSLYATMEHGNIFRNLKHTRTSKH